MSSARCLFRYGPAAAALFAAALLVAVAVPALAGENSKTDEQTTKAETPKSAASIDFARTLGVPSASLQSLGARIEQSRSSADPIGLAAAASELAAVEHASGKKAELTAAALMKESVALATMRGYSQEARAVAALTPDAADKKALGEIARRLVKVEEERAAAAKNGEITRGIHNNLNVRNDSCQHVRVFYCGRYQGSVEPHSFGSFHICDHNHGQHCFDLEARGCDGGYWRHHGSGDFHDFNWGLRE